MKKVLMVCVLATTGMIAFGQKAQLNLYSAYVFDDSFETYNSSTDYYTGKVYGGFQWGAGIEFKVREDYGVELLYQRQDTKANASYYYLTSIDRQLDIGVNYAMLGFNRYIRKDKVEPYAGLVLGAMFASNKNPVAGEDDSITKFALGGRLGVNIWASEKVAVKLQVQLLSSVQGMGGGFYFGTGGAGAGVSSYSTITQLGIGGGLAFKLGQAE